MSKTLSKNVSAKVLNWLLKPVAQFCLKSGIKLQSIVEHLKDVLVEEAEAEIQTQNSPRHEALPGLEECVATESHHRR